jgi:hypothetical protein
VGVKSQRSKACPNSIYFPLFFKQQVRQLQYPSGKGLLSATQILKNQKQIEKPL